MSTIEIWIQSGDWKSLRDGEIVSCACECLGNKGYLLKCIVDLREVKSLNCRAGWRLAIQLKK